MSLQLKRKRKYITGSLRIKLWESNNKLCSECGAKTVVFKCECGNLYDDNYIQVGHVDHIIPFADGGECHENNYRWVCAPCNYSKNIGRKRK